MTDSDLKLLRHALLLQLHDAAPNPVRLRTLANGAVSAGFNGLSADRIEGEMQHLSDKEYCQPIRDPMAAGLRQWRLSAAGREYLEENHLV
jgi:hypothetical protein